MSQVERISRVIDEQHEGGTTGFFMGVHIEKFDRDRLIKLISIQMATNHRAQERAKQDYEFLGYLKGSGRG